MKACSRCATSPVSPLPGRSGTACVSGRNRIRRCGSGCFTGGGAPRSAAQHGPCRHSYPAWAFFSPCTPGHLSVCPVQSVVGDKQRTPGLSGGARRFGSGCHTVGYLRGGLAGIGPSIGFCEVKSINWVIIYCKEAWRVYNVPCRSASAGPRRNHVPAFVQSLSSHG